MSEGERTIELKAGDAIYFEKHLAFAVLIERKDRGWLYSLRSPKANDLDNHLLKMDYHTEREFVDAILNGRFKYFKGKADD